MHNQFLGPLALQLTVFLNPHQVQGQRKNKLGNKFGDRSSYILVVQRPKLVYVSYVPVQRSGSLNCHADGINTVVSPQAMPCPLEAPKTLNEPKLILVRQLKPTQSFFPFSGPAPRSLSHRPSFQLPASCGLGVYVQSSADQPHLCLHYYKLQQLHLT